MTPQQLWVELAIHELALEIARQKGPYSALAMPASPHETARALYLLGWRPPFESDDLGSD